MSFLNPLYLIGAALVALPIVLHLLRRDVAPPVPFTAVRLLRKSPIDRSRRHRLRDLLLLAARVCALILLAGSFARPYFAGAPGTTRTTVIAIDRSFSMAAPGRMERAKALARQAIEEARGDRVAVVAFDERADVLAAPGAPADARAAVDRVQPGYGATRYAAPLDKAAELLQDESLARVILVSDLQPGGIDQAGAVLPEGIDFVVQDASQPAAGAASNMSVTTVAIERRQIRATVRNFGPSARTVDVSSTGDGRLLPPKPVMVPAGEAVDVAFDAGADVRSASVRIAGDSGGYPADDERFALVEVRTLPRVLIVTGAPGTTAGFYLSRALQADGDEGPDFDVKLVTGQMFSAMDIAQESAIALLSTHGLDRRAGEALRAYLAGGGGVFVAAGPDVDPAVLSTMLEWQPALAPREARTAGAMAATDLRHPVLRPFDAVAANFGQVLFERAWRIDAGASWRVVARYTGDGAAALAERAGGQGRVLLFTSDVDRRWNDFPLHASFVPFAQEAARYLGARPPDVSSYLVGDAPAGVEARPGVFRAGARTLAINVDARESAVDRATPGEFRKAVTRSASQARPRAERLAKQTEGQQNYWRYGLMLMLATLVVEAFIGSR